MAVPNQPPAPPSPSGLSDEEALAVVDKIYTYIEEKKNGNERTNRLIARLGIDDLKAYLAE